jgi:nuclear GTP-binding protein
VPELLPAPGAERVGQAQIVTELGKPFELAGLFGAADSGAFGDDADEAIVREDAVMQDGEEKMEDR